MVPLNFLFFFPLMFQRSNLCVNARAFSLMPLCVCMYVHVPRVCVHLCVCVCIHMHHACVCVHCVCAYMHASPALLNYKYQLQIFFYQNAQDCITSLVADVCLTPDFETVKYISKIGSLERKSCILLKLG